MRFTPKTEEQLAEENLWPEGEYSFQVMEQVTLGSKTIYTMDTTSKKSGAEMIQLVLQVINLEGQFITVFDYLQQAMQFKLLHAAEACGLMDKYEAGILTAADFKSKTGKLLLRRGKAQEGFAPKNEVKDYLVPGRAEAPAKTAKDMPSRKPVTPLDDDIIPF